jgi:hypothetical protein
VEAALQPDLRLQLSLGGVVEPSPTLRVWKAAPDPAGLVAEVERLTTRGGKASTHTIDLALVERRPSAYSGPLRLRENGLALKRASERGPESAWGTLCALLWQRDLVFHRMYPPPWRWGDTIPEPAPTLPGVCWAKGFLSHQVRLRRQVIEQRLGSPPLPPMQPALPESPAANGSRDGDGSDEDFGIALELGRERPPISDECGV